MTDDPETKEILETLQRILAQMDVMLDGNIRKLEALIEEVRGIRKFMKERAEGKQ